MKNNMRLIDADALLEFAMNRYHKTVIPSDIVTFPTVDAKPVVHGRWEHIYEGKYFLVRCAACGVDAIKINCKNFNSVTVEWAYCPNCGAKMDGGD